MRKLPPSFQKAILNAEKHIRLLDTTGGLSQMEKFQKFMSDPDVQKVFSDFSNFQNVIGSHKPHRSTKNESPVVKKSNNRGPTINHYAFMLGADYEKSDISNHQYESIVSHASKYDFLIDGLALKICRKAPRSHKSTVENLTNTEFWMISQLILHGGRKRPISIHPHKGVQNSTAIKQLEEARRKLEGKKPRGKYKIISSLKQLNPEDKEFEFTPNEDLSWLLIMPIPGN